MDLILFCWSDFLEVTANIVTILGVVAIFIGVWTHNLNIKQFNFSVLVRCITVYQDKFLNKLPTESTAAGKAETTKIINDYIDFVNEELFYFQQKFIPKDVALEWIDGMINVMPIYSSDGKLLNSNEKTAELIHKENVTHTYNRIKKAFTINGQYDWDLIYSKYQTAAQFEKRDAERLRLVKEIYANLVLK
ncbi:MAG TPA: hypothetical protein VK168_16570 [Saprospiraceae bacterium]|nr:hypothetical protein [Saprospiraceae bacterium]